MVSRSAEGIDCSLKGLLRISAPVAFSMLSGTLMQILDRVMLSHYSLEAMNGAAVASQVLDTFILPLLSFATVSEVIVGQLNGSRQQKRTAIPIAQITLFLLSCLLVLMPLFIRYEEVLLPKSLHGEGLPYFRLGMYAFPFYIIFSSLSAFFVGTRRPFVIIPCVVIANILNAVLDVVLIFGMGPIPAMGALGAAWASFAAALAQCLVLLLFFVSPSHAKTYATRKLRFDASLFRKNIILGAPYAVSEFVEMCVWVAVSWFLEAVSTTELTLHTVAVVLWIFFLFVLEGFQKGVMALASNSIGAGLDENLKRLLGSMAKLTMWGAGVMSLPLVVVPKFVLKIVFDIHDAATLQEGAVVLILLWVSLVLVLFITSGLGGILSAGGDTTFLMVIKTLSIILCVALPGWYAWSNGRLTAVVVWVLSGVQAVFNGVCFLMRYRSRKWKHSLAQ